MSNSIVPDSAPGGKSSRAHILSRWLNDADYTLEAFESWHRKLTSWQQAIMTPEQFHSGYIALETASLHSWAEAVGLADLKATLMDEPAIVLARWVRETGRTVQVLRVWRASLDSWQHRRVSLADFEATVAMLQDVHLESWLGEDVRALREVVVAE